jgi:hypothetical protein
LNEASPHSDAGFTVSSRMENNTDLRTRKMSRCFFPSVGKRLLKSLP